jgi:RNA-dependent RNA polymerase
VKPEKLKEDNRRYNHKPPAWKSSMLDAEEVNALDNKYPNQAHPQRPLHLSRFIMDRLAHQAKALDDRFRKQVDQHYQTLPYRKPDDALTAVYRDIVRRSQSPGGEGYLDDLALIKTHVEDLYSEHRRIVGAINFSDSSNLNASPSKGQTPKTSPRKPAAERSPQKGGAAFTSLPIEKRQDILRALSKQFASSPNPQLTHMPKDLLNRVKASYAYFYEYQQNAKTDFRFAFDVAFRELCAMKAQTMPAGFKVVSNEFYDKFSLKLPKTLQPKSSIR